MGEQVIKIELVANLEKELQKLPSVETKAQATAEAIAARARQFAPVDTGKYKAGIKVQKTNKRNSGIWRVLASDQKSFWVEFGVPSRDIQGQFPLRQAVESLGLTWAKRKK